MTEIAERAGMGLGALYRYFPNKQSILRAVTSGAWVQPAGSFVTPLVDSDAPIRELIPTRSPPTGTSHRDEPFRLRLRLPSTAARN